MRAPSKRFTKWIDYDIQHGVLQSSLFDAHLQVLTQFELLAFLRSGYGIDLLGEIDVEEARYVVRALVAAGHYVDTHRRETTGNVYVMTAAGAVAAAKTEMNAYVYEPEDEGDARSWAEAVKQVRGWEKLPRGSNDDAGEEPRWDRPGWDAWLS